MEQSTLPLAIVPADPAICPVCGAENTCAVAAGLPPQACWCMTTDMPMDMLIALPAAERSARCVCQACIDHWERTAMLRNFVPE